MAHSAQPTPTLQPLAHNQILRYGPYPITKSCAVAHSVKIVTDFYCAASFRTVAHSA
jgi:hypothetical protein